MKFALTSLLLAAIIHAAEPLHIEATLVDAGAISFGTFSSYNQKVVQNRRGIFMTHIRTRNEKYTAQQWRLSWSQDGVRMFKTLLEATDAPKPGSPLYCISRSIRQDGLVCLISRDNGSTWHDYAVGTKFNQPCAVGGCRSVTADGHIIGSFTELEGTEIKKIRGGKVWFFKIKAE